jgi:hypothetical protein
VLPAEPLVEAGDAAAVREGAQLVAPADGRPGLAHHEPGQPPAAAVGPGGDALHVAGPQRAAAGAQGPVHHGRVRDQLAVLDGEHVHPAEGVVPVLLGEPSRAECRVQQPAQGPQLVLAQRRGRGPPQGDGGRAHAGTPPLARLASDCGKRKKPSGS